MGEPRAHDDAGGRDHAAVEVQPQPRGAAGGQAERVEHERLQRARRRERDTLTRSLTAALCGLVVLPASAAAANDENAPLHLSGGDAAKAVADHSSGGTGAIVRTIVGLAVVIAVIYGVTWILKQVKGSREATRSGDADLEQVSTLPLGPNAALHLVRAGNEVVQLDEAVRHGKLRHRGSAR